MKLGISLMIFVGLLALSQMGNTQKIQKNRVQVEAGKPWAVHIKIYFLGGHCFNFGWFSHLRRCQRRIQFGGGNFKFEIRSKANFERSR